ncbi:MAG TPA: trehalase family glycosidase [Candidatus Saccharimonadales bacterium]|nr:trehalase family glycosidase [Candidatus Saccharimonadales bacterium]
METLELRPPFDVAPVDPLTVAPDPGPMGQMYIGAREKYYDGMTLACATPNEGWTYDAIKEEYSRRCQEPGFSDVAFFDEHFTVTPADSEPLVAKFGMSLDDYTEWLRPKFIFPNTDNKHFDVWLPYNRAVAGAGRFGRHSFLWDGYQMAKGYAADGEWDKVLDVVDNTEYQINRFGYPLNGSADFYATRAQPDYFSHEVRMLADHFGPEVLVRYLPAMEKNHMGYWMDGMEELSALPLDGRAHAHRTLIRMPDGSFLNRYWDDADGPRLESYKEDIEVAELAVSGLSGAIREAKLSKVYRDLRAGAASGWDYSSRWFEDGQTLATINTTDIAPVDLNSLMAYNEESLAMAYEAAATMGGAYGKTSEECLSMAAKYWDMWGRRVEAINAYNYDPNDKIYRDHNFIKGEQTRIVSAAMSYPLYVGISNLEQTVGVVEATERDLLYEGGIIATTTENSTQQWDGGSRDADAEKDGKEPRSKNVWAPPNWAYIRGVARMAHQLVAEQVDADPEIIEWLLQGAERAKNAYESGVERAFRAHGVVPEKHRGDIPEVLATGGEYALVKVLAMPGETWRALRKLKVRDAGDHLSLSKYPDFASRVGRIALPV